MKHVEINESGGALWVILNRPEVRNAFSSEMRESLKEALAKADSDESIRCVVIKGAGGNFISGGDLKKFAELIERPSCEVKHSFYNRVQDLNQLIMMVMSLKKPVVACVEGSVAGAGVSLALACDLVVASDDAKFIISYSKVGASPDGGLSFYLPRAVGIKKYMELVMLGGSISADEAMDYGLINFVFENAELSGKTEELVSRLCNGPTYAFGKMKNLSASSESSSLVEQLHHEAVAFSECASTDDFREGVSSFFEKRKAKFLGL